MNGPTDGDDGRAVGANRGDGDGTVEGRDAVNFFTIILLLISHGAEDGSENHAGAMYEGERLVKTDGAVLGIVGNSGREYGEISGREVKGGGGSAECGVEVEIGVGGLGNGLAVVTFGFGHGARDERDGHGRESDKAEALVNLEHLGSLIEFGLEMRVSLRLLRSETEVGERRRLRSR